VLLDYMELEIRREAMMLSEACAVTMRLLAIDLPVPDHSTLSRRAFRAVHVLEQARLKSFVERANGCSKNTELRNAGPGASFISASTPAVTRPCGKHTRDSLLL
jgi:hypothetical protein